MRSFLDLSLLVLVISGCVNQERLADLEGEVADLEAFINRHVRDARSGVGDVLPQAPSFDEVFSISRPIADRVLIERGDAMVKFWTALNPACGWSNHDAGYRSRFLSRRYHHLQMAVRNLLEHQDASLVVRRAKNLNATINRSNLYKSCWNTMRDTSSAIGASVGSAIERLAAITL